MNSRTTTSSPVTAMNTNLTSSQDATQAKLSHIEQVRMLILGMEQRLQVREEKLSKTMEKAERESGLLENVRKEVLSL